MVTMEKYLPSFTKLLHKVRNIGHPAWVELTDNGRII